MVIRQGYQLLGEVPVLGVLGVGMAIVPASLICTFERNSNSRSPRFESNIHALRDKANVAVLFSVVYCRCAHGRDIFFTRENR